MIFVSLLTIYFWFKYLLTVSGVAYDSSINLSSNNSFTITTFAGNTLVDDDYDPMYSYLDGFGTNSKFHAPYGIAISSDGTFALITDVENSLIRQIILSTSNVTTLAGGPGDVGYENDDGTNTNFYFPYGITISLDGLFAIVADTYNNLIRKIVISTRTVSTVAGGGSSTGTSAGFNNAAGTNALFNHPNGVIFSSDGSFLLIVDTNNNMIRQMIMSTAVVTTLAGQITSGTTNGEGTNSKFNNPQCISISSDGTYALITDSNNNMIRKLIITTASVTTLAGQISAGSNNGIGTNSQFNKPSGISISPDGVYALIGDYNNNMIRQIILSTTFVTTLAGQTTTGSTNGIGTNSKFDNIGGIDISPDGSYALIADYSNNLIRKMYSISPTSTLTPTGAGRSF